MTHFLCPFFEYGIFLFISSPNQSGSSVLISPIFRSQPMLAEHGEHPPARDQARAQRDHRHRVGEPGRHPPHPQRAGHLRHPGVHRRAVRHALPRRRLPPQAHPVQGLSRPAAQGLLRHQDLPPQRGRQRRDLREHAQEGTEFTIGNLEFGIVYFKLFCL